MFFRLAFAQNLASMREWVSLSIVDYGWWMLFKGTQNILMKNKHALNKDRKKTFQPKDI